MRLSLQSSMISVADDMAMLVSLLSLHECVHEYVKKNVIPSVIQLEHLQVVSCSLSCMYYMYATGPVAHYLQRENIIYDLKYKKR